jgi:hypothetical protein
MAVHKSQRKKLLRERPENEAGSLFAYPNSIRAALEAQISLHDSQSNQPSTAVIKGIRERGWSLAGARDTW